MIIDDSLFILLRRTRPELAISRWIEERAPYSAKHITPICLYPEKTQFLAALQNHFPHYSTDESKYIFKYIHETKLGLLGEFKNLGVFGLIAKSVEDYLTVDSRNECLCRYKSLIKFRDLTHPMDPMIFVAAFLARHDIEHCFQREVFSWPTIVRCDNIRLHHMLDGGMAENHFHIGGSSDAFIFSWICLMNHFTPARRDEFKRAQMDQNPLDTVFIGTASNESSFSLTFKASCIRYFLFQRLNNGWPLPQSGKRDENGKLIDDIRQVNEEWLEKMLSLTDEECDIHCSKLNAMFSSMRAFCTPVDDSGFIPDYAMYYEPLAPMDNNDLPYRFNTAIRNYERRLYRPLSGEQRFLYSLFRSVFRQDPMIMPYLDIAYAYLLIYCQIRGELMQINKRVGFANFLQYQDRKDIFTENFPEYDAMRTSIAIQSVLQNPQVISFEGRLAPATNGVNMYTKIKNLIELSKGAKGIQNVIDKNSDASPKLSFVLHFLKHDQWTSDNDYELLSPRDSNLRKKNALMANAVIETMEKHPEIMKYVTAIDAASDEINCRPEVFAPYFRKIKGFRRCSELCGYYEDQLIPIPRITYHAGEDFLDPIDGMRAIDEAIRFCEMQAGDRLGHALALGIDCEKWYHFKHNTVLLRKQDHLDNLVWLYGKMHQYGCFNSGAEDQIMEQFRKYFNEIYTSNLDDSLHSSKLFSVDIMNYYASFGLRGNDPTLYISNPELGPNTLESIKEAEENGEEWRVRKNYGSSYDPLSMILFHYYHFNPNMKKTADRPIAYQMTKEIIQAVCAVQERMMYDIASGSICIECNPSSNYLIGTFKDYMQHPIFTFNSKHLYPPTHPKYAQKNPYICASINTDDLGIFSTNLENEYALMACALETYNDYCHHETVISPDNIYKWLDQIRQNGCMQSFLHIDRSKQMISDVGD